MDWKYLVFSSIGGTFLDEKGRTAIRPGMINQEFPDGRVIFASSRTLEEIAWLQEKMRYHEDFIAENGGLICTWKRDRAETLGCDQSVECEEGRVYYRVLAASEEEVRRIFASAAYDLDAAKLVRHKMSPEITAELEMITPAEAFRGLSRRASLLFSASASRREVDRLRIRLAQAGCRLEKGGKWWLVRKGGGKDAAIREYLDRMFPERGLVTVGIGDAPNDRDMLAECSLKFAVNHPVMGHAMEIALLKDSVRLTREGIDGWKEMLDILKKK